MTVSYGLAKKLKEAGIEVESTYFYSDTDKEFMHRGVRFQRPNEANAPMLHEILEVMPADIMPDNVGCYTLRLIKWNLSLDKKPIIKYHVNYYDERLDENLTNKAFENENPAEAAGQLLLWLGENNYLDKK